MILLQMGMRIAAAPSSPGPVLPRGLLARSGGSSDPRSGVPDRGTWCTRAAARTRGGAASTSARADSPWSSSAAPGIARSAPAVHASHLRTRCTPCLPDGVLNGGRSAGDSIDFHRSKGLLMNAGSSVGCVDEARSDASIAEFTPAIGFHGSAVVGGCAAHHPERHNYYSEYKVPHKRWINVISAC
jgi:hypothetical protein